MFHSWNCKMKKLCHKRLGSLRKSFNWSYTIQCGCFSSASPKFILASIHATRNRFDVKSTKQKEKRNFHDWLHVTHYFSIEFLSWPHRKDICLEDKINISIRTHICFYQTPPSFCEVGNSSLHLMMGIQNPGGKPDFFCYPNLTRLQKMLPKF